MGWRKAKGWWRRCINSGQGGGGVAVRGSCVLKCTVNPDDTLIGVIRTNTGPVTVSISRVAVAPPLESALYWTLCVYVCVHVGFTYVSERWGLHLFWELHVQYKQDTRAPAVDAEIFFLCGSARAEQMDAQGWGGGVAIQ